MCDKAEGVLEWQLFHWALDIQMRTAHSTFSSVDL